MDHRKSDIKYYQIYQQDNRCLSVIVPSRSIPNFIILESGRWVDRGGHNPGHFVTILLDQACKLPSKVLAVKMGIVHSYTSSYNISGEIIRVNITQNGYVKNVRRDGYLLQSVVVYKKRS